MSTIKAVAVAALPYSADGVTVLFAPAGAEFDCPSHLFDGLLDGGFIAKPDPKASAEAAAAKAKAEAEAEAEAEAAAKAKADADAAAKAKAEGDLFTAPKGKQ